MSGTSMVNVQLSDNVSIYSGLGHAPFGPSHVLPVTQADAAILVQADLAIIATPPAPPPAPPQEPPAS